jgi:T-complex protein 1 subunit gamma
MLVLNQNTQRDTGRSAQLANIGAAQAVSGIVRSTLGPRAMLKMLLDPMGGIVITNDANAILREVDVSHPAAKQMIELSRAQDEEVGDGTTSVIVLTGEMLQVAEPLLQRNIHPTMICRGYARALTRLSVPLPLFPRRSISRTTTHYYHWSNPASGPNSLPDGVTASLRWPCKQR